MALEGFDDAKDPIGLFASKELVCGKCNAAMINLGMNKFKCSKCGIVFDELYPKPQD